MALEEIRRDREQKLTRLEGAGFDPYPALVGRNFLIGDARKEFSRLLRTKKKITIAGRIRAWRGHGGATFADIEDASGRIQLYVAREDLRDAYDLLTDVADIGDFFEISGRAFKTKRGELTLRVSQWRMIAKSLAPLPEQWHGLKDVEERFRKRYLDLLMNEDVRRRFVLRSHVIRAVRNFFDGEGFIEVETPMLQDVPGGAIARPFRTHHNALDTDLFLRIAPELYLKRLLVGGLEKVYELGKSFRNEGIDVSHNPEFTTVEWYAAYWDEAAMMRSVERCIAFLVKHLKLKRTIMFDGKPVHLGGKFPRITFADALKRYALIADYAKETRDSLAVKARQFGIDVEEGASKGKIADEIYKKVCRPHLVDPTFVTGHPVDISPLAKRVSRDSDETRRFQLVAGGLELVNAFSELNDPRDQRARFMEQQKMRAGGDDESHPFDKDFVAALEYGMPPAAGGGIGIDRLVMLLTDSRNVREVLLFPTLRPRT